MSQCQSIILEPFISLDWNHNWQYHFRERGASGFNIVLNDQYNSLFRTELGLRFFETYCYEWGEIIMEENVSYVNRTPTHRKGGTASFIGANSTFDVETFNRCSQNLGKVQIHVECTPSNLRNIYAAFDYQGEFGSSFQSNIITFSLGKDF